MWCVQMYITKPSITQNMFYKFANMEAHASYLFVKKKKTFFFLNIVFKSLSV